MNIPVLSFTGLSKLPATRKVPGGLDTVMEPWKARGGNHEDALPCGPVRWADSPGSHHAGNKPLLKAYVHLPVPGSAGCPQ